MKKLNKFHKSLLILLGFVIFIFFWINFILSPPPRRTWTIENPESEHTEKINVYSMPNKEGNALHWCGNIKYENDIDCEFRILITNPLSDTLYNRVIKAPKVSQYNDKELEFSITRSKDVIIQYIPVNVPKSAKVTFHFKNYSNCLD
jgi:hypothetical protein